MSLIVSRSKMSDANYGCTLAPKTLYMGAQDIRLLIRIGSSDRRVLGAE